MNFEHLDMILNQYIQNFDELNAREGHDEGYKWRAVRCFQEQWNRDESAWEDGLAGKFKAATKETENLVDNAWVQPNAGILALLKHKQEEDFVRACFEELFCADNGDLNKRWDRIVAFMEKINDRLDHYGKPKTYRQTNNSVIYYLNLWRPEENYIFKATEVKSWAQCIEYGDDFGEGKSFSLDKYYRMCDELLAELPKYEELMHLHNERAAKEMQGYDDKLHILVYDIIYCAEHYGFYSRMHIEKLSATERVRRAKIRDQQKTLAQQIHEKEDQLKMLEVSKIALPDLTGFDVRHRVFGSGKVISCSDEKLTIDFAGSQKILSHIDIIAKEILCFEDAAIVAQARHLAEVQAEEKKARVEIKQLKGRLATL